MTVKKERLWVVTCTECPMATNDAPKFIFGSDIEKRADEMREAHAKYHVDKDAQTEDVLKRAAQTRAAMAKSISETECQCYCPRHNVSSYGEGVCTNARDIVFRCPDVPGFARTLIVCEPCANALKERFEETITGLAYRVATHEDRPPLWEPYYEEARDGSTDERPPDGGGASEVEAPQSASGNGPVGGGLHVASSSWTPGRR